MGTQIKIDNLVKVFGSGQAAATACDHLTMTIEPGELFFLLGPSGCGKTTLLRMIAGFIDPTSGTVAFDGKDVTHEAPNKRNTGMVFPVLCALAAHDGCSKCRLRAQCP